MPATIDVVYQFVTDPEQRFLGQRVHFGQLSPEKVENNTAGQRAFESHVLTFVVSIQTERSNYVWHS